MSSPATGTSYFACSSNTTCQVVPTTPYNATSAERRQVIQATERINDETPLNKELCEPVSTRCKEDHNLNNPISHNIELNKTPTPKQRRRKHRPKVITEGKSRRIKEPVTPKPVQSKENTNGKRKYVRKKVLNSSTPQTEVTSVPESAKTCRRSLNFDQSEQPRVGNPACSENGTTQSPGTSHLKSNYPWAVESSSSKGKGKMIVADGQENREETLSESVAHSSPHDYSSSKSTLTTTQVLSSKRKHYGTSEHADSGSTNLRGAHHNVLQAYNPECWVPFHKCSEETEK